jgi:hypothetical protein
MSRALDPKLTLASCYNEAWHCTFKISTIPSNPAKATMALAIAANRGSRPGSLLCEEHLQTWSLNTQDGSDIVNKIVVVDYP